MSRMAIQVSKQVNSLNIVFHTERLIFHPVKNRPQERLTVFPAMTTGLPFLSECIFSFLHAALDIINFTAFCGLMH